MSTMRLSKAGRALRRSIETSTKTASPLRPQQQQSFSIAPVCQIQPSKEIIRSVQQMRSRNHASCPSSISPRAVPPPTAAAGCFFSTTASSQKKRSSVAHNNEPVPTSPPKTDFSHMDMLGQTPIPSVSVDVCAPDGFTLNSGVVVQHGDGCLLLGGEAFVWRPWNSSSVSLSESGSSSSKSSGLGGSRRGLLNSKGQFEISAEALGVLGLVWPRPDLLIVGTGRGVRPLSPATRRAVSELGVRVDVMDTRNAASQFNLLATERGVDDVAAALVPLGWDGED